MFHRILVPIDGSGAGRQGLSEALRLAPAWGATLRLLNVTCACRFDLEMTTPAALEGYRRSLKERADHLLDDASALGRKAGLVVETTVRELVHGTPASAILEEAACSDCDLIVMGTHGRSGLARVAAVSNAEEVVRKSAVPVLVVRRPEGRRHRAPAETLTTVKARRGAVPTLA
jgi:nucleotide-binding universal stress UspA family protein